MSFRRTSIADTLSAEHVEALQAFYRGMVTANKGRPSGVNAIAEKIGIAAGDFGAIPRPSEFEQIQSHLRGLQFRLDEITANKPEDITESLKHLQAQIDDLRVLMGIANENYGRF